ncbi:MAG TPA: urease accessory protein UreE [Alphaproteobacteria bacterium]|jgi:urease accessory protein|nr:urease accessory protein UreE [Alphaproteobacteria bacterium]HIC72171.1 urease accessory protein UreE [Alphaproteobacteria bacterium]
MDGVTLDYDARHRRRYRLRTNGGEDVLLDLAEAVAMADGDGLRLDDNHWLSVQAGQENLIEITADNFEHLTRIAWHLGNRHLPAAISADRILIRPDHVIESMVIGLDASIHPVTEPFQPEYGAYHEHRHSPSSSTS